MNPYSYSSIETSYVTPEGRKTVLANTFPNLVFYYRMCGVVRRAGCKAKKGNYSAKDWIYSSEEIMTQLERCGVTINVEGMNHVRELDGPCVFVGNHMSTLETFTLPGLIQPHKDVTFIVKDSLLKYPFFGPVLASRSPIAVTRKNLREDLNTMINGGFERLSAGRSVIVFPQSSRSVQLIASNFNSIGVKLAKKANVPVIPIALRTDAWGTGSLVKDFGPVNPKLAVHFKFGAPIAITGNGKAEQTEIFNFIKTSLEAWGIKGEGNEGA